ncbi:MAG: nitronate monooxygenase [Chloroflexi bacterium]|nr:nitronate monooxygenase [Chloroflexota bacterium]
MKRTRLCDILDIEYPIIQGGMTLIANAELAAAVSNAGGLGIIAANVGSARLSYTGNLAEALRQEIHLAQSLTDKPFGVNYPIGETERRELLEVAVAEKVKVVTTSAGSPSLYTKFFKDAGIKVLHVVASVRHAKKAEAEGVDAVIAEGYEAGGHNGLDELPTMVLLPQVVDAVFIPVVAAGGIADARGVVAALALGAEGVQMGTRFVATTECLAHPRFKEAVVRASDTDTVIWGRRLGPTRTLKNKKTFKILELEALEDSAGELQEVVGNEGTRQGHVEGDLENGMLDCGAVAGLVKDIISAGEVVRRIVAEVPYVLASLQQS